MGFGKNRPECALNNIERERDEEKLNEIVTIFLINTEDFNARQQNTKKWAWLITLRDS